MANRWGNNGNVIDFIFLGSKITVDSDCSHEIKSHLLLGRKAMTNTDSVLKRRDITADKGPSGHSCFFSSGHVWMWELDHKESWAPKKGSFRTVMLEKTLQSPLECKEIKPVNRKGNEHWTFTGRTGAEAPVFKLPNAKSQLTGKDPDAGKDGGQEGTTEGEVVGWHHWLNGREQTLGDGERQGGLACCSPWGLKEWDTTEWLNKRQQVPPHNPSETFQKDTDKTQHTWVFWKGFACVRARRASLVAQSVKSAFSAMQEMWFGPWTGKIPWRGRGQPAPMPLPGKLHWRGDWRATTHVAERVGHDWATDPPPPAYVHTGPHPSENCKSCF